jgi:hypothetical protein
VGELRLTSHTGDLEISVPSSASVEIRGRTEKGESDPDLADRIVPLPVTSGNLLRRGTKSASSLILRSFKRNIHVKRTP